jgi:hypothetical protein
VRKLIDALPVQGELELFTDEEERVTFDDDPDTEEFQRFEIMTDTQYPGQYRVVGGRIEKMVKMTNWDCEFLYDLRIQHIL